MSWYKLLNCSCYNLGTAAARVAGCRATAAARRPRRSAGGCEAGRRPVGRGVWLQAPGHRRRRRRIPDYCAESGAAIPEQAIPSPARENTEHSPGSRTVIAMAIRIRRPDQLPQTWLRLYRTRLGGRQGAALTSGVDAPPTVTWPVTTLAARRREPGRTSGQPVGRSGPRRTR